MKLVWYYWCSNNEKCSHRNWFQVELGEIHLEEEKMHLHWHTVHCFRISSAYFNNFPFSILGKKIQTIQLDISYASRRTHVKSHACVVVPASFRITHLHACHICIDASPSHPPLPGKPPLLATLSTRRDGRQTPLAGSWRAKRCQNYVWC